MQASLLLTTLLGVLALLANACVQEIDKSQFQFATPEQKAADVDVVVDTDVTATDTSSVAADLPDAAADSPDAPDTAPDTTDAEAELPDVVAETADAAGEVADGSIDVGAELGPEVDAGPVCSAAQCDDGNPCTDEGCDLKSGVCANLVKADGANCDDSSKCTSGDTCKAGTCAGKAVACNDGNPCTSDACLPASGCTTTANDGAACDDDNPCTQGDTCAGTQCTAGKPTACPANEPCIAWKCGSGAGQVQAGLLGRRHGLR